MKMALRFKRTMAEVLDAEDYVTYRCMRCVRRELPADKLQEVLRWHQIHIGSGLFAQSWLLVQVREPCASCDPGIPPLLLTDGT